MLICISNSTIFPSQFVKALMSANLSGARSRPRGQSSEGKTAGAAGAHTSEAGRVVQAGLGKRVSDQRRSFDAGTECRGRQRQRDAAGRSTAATG